MYALSPWHLLLVAAALSFVHAVYTAIYRLYFHPLAKVPGPKLAALTKWVETYYDCIKRPGGQFMFAYQAWHDKYGPIVRIGPNEVHIRDPSFYVDVLFAQSRHSSRILASDNRFSLGASAFATGEHYLHKRRRAALNPMFAKKEISKYADTIRDTADQMCRTVASDFLASGEVLTLNRMWGAFVADVVMGYVLDESYDFVSRTGFESLVVDFMLLIFDPIHLMTNFPIVGKVIFAMPHWAVRRLSRANSFYVDFRDRIIAKAKQLDGTARPSRAETKGAQTQKTSLLDALMASDLPIQDLSAQRLEHEGMAVTIAGMESTTNALCTASFHILANEPVLARLVAELRTAIPDPDALPGVDALMQLPYLSAVVEEALRFSYGVASRLPRHSPTPISYAGFVIPPDCVISMDHYSVSHDPSLFPEPFEFKPERWLDNPLAPDGRPLSRYMVTFGRGTRSCLGMHLAYANLYTGLASFFRRYEAQLYETGRECVDVAMDRLVARPRPGTKGVRVLVRGLRGRVGEE